MGKHKHKTPTVTVPAPPALDWVLVEEAVVTESQFLPLNTRIATVSDNPHFLPEQVHKSKDNNISSSNSNSSAINTNKLTQPTFTIEEEEENGDSSSPFTKLNNYVNNNSNSNSTNKNNPSVIIDMQGDVPKTTTPNEDAFHTALANLTKNASQPESQVEIVNHDIADMTEVLAVMKKGKQKQSNSSRKAPAQGDQNVGTNELGSSTSGALLSDNAAPVVDEEADWRELAFGAATKQQRKQLKALIHIYELNNSITTAANHSAQNLVAALSTLSPPQVQQHERQLLDIVGMMNKIMMLASYRLAWQRTIKLKWGVKFEKIVTGSTKKFVRVLFKSSVWYYIALGTLGFTAFVAGIVLSAFLGPWVGILLIGSSAAVWTSMKARQQDGNAKKSGKKQPIMWNPKLTKQLNKVSQSVSTENLQADLNEVQESLRALLLGMEVMSKDIIAIKTCTICQCFFDGDQHCPARPASALGTTCNHIFCSSCLEEMLRIRPNNLCPLCRAPFYTVDYCVCLKCHTILDNNNNNNGEDDDYGDVGAENKRYYMCNNRHFLCGECVGVKKKAKFCPHCRHPAEIVTTFDL